ncbi:hypothetical protein [Sulfolobus sp. E11-6]|uniref:hypothetical protein n=1 Tax=Sulfolobus sp. E11-6 TaxID=2663020 RepID=UPI001294B053|nr:hypothetical protein [Sulfolobus sp. E11-6]QGA67774.1 hypothetical protein GFS33_02130 [Sulfolobus sp. E11-6]
MAVAKNSMRRFVIEKNNAQLHNTLPCPPPLILTLWKTFFIFSFFSLHMAQKTLIAVICVLVASFLFLFFYIHMSQNTQTATPTNPSNLCVCAMIPAGNTTYTYTDIINFTGKIIIPNQTSPWYIQYLPEIIITAIVDAFVISLILSPTFRQILRRYLKL